MIFRRAKLRLTLWFAAVQLAVFGVFALAVYAYVTRAFDIDGISDSAGSTADAGFESLRIGLLFAYAALVVVVPVISYALATLAIRPIRDGYEAQQRFVDDASHEFRTPLSAIQAQLELGLDRRRPSSEYRMAMARSLTAVSRLSGMLDELLMLSRGDRLAGSLEQVDLSEPMREAVEQERASGDTRIEISELPVLWVRGSSAMLSRAVLNLLTNALRYSPTSEPVVVTLMRRGRFARIEVRDRGAGLSRLDSRRAFDRFWRAEAARSAQGSGLGLSIVLEIVRLHGGRVRLSAANGPGTVAAIEIPLSR
ncbi:hypothetical protein BH11ACT3_BH11ACT3_23630 [soil metagenome]